MKTKDQKQGYQIEGIFAYWTIVYFGHFLKNHRSSPNFWTTFYHSKSYVLILAKYGLGYILGDFYKLIWPPW
jgi:hypothetical protein